MVLPIPHNLCTNCKGRGEIETLEEIRLCGVCKGEGEITENGEELP